MNQTAAAKAAARLIPAIVLSLSGLLVSTVQAGATPPTNVTYTCKGGTIPGGTYDSLLVTGVCSMPTGTIVVRGGVTVAAGALLDAVTPGDPPGSPTVPATVTIGGSVSVGRGGVFLLGCSPNITCTSPPAITYDRIDGNLSATGALGVVVHSASIGGTVSLDGGGGGVNCNSSPAKAPSLPAPAPWSEDAGLSYTPVYSDFEDVAIPHNLSVTGLHSCWLGAVRDQIGGTVTFADNTMADPDANEIVNNVISGSLVCDGNTAGGVASVQFGDTGAAPNVVGKAAAGQCGFNVFQPNPGPEAGAGPGVPEHISVPTSSLTVYFGTRSQSGPTVKTIHIGVTTSGDTLLAQLNDVVFAGAGIRGTLTVNPSAPPGSSGEAVAITRYPNGSESFTAYETCTVCTFDHQSGSVTLRAYGTVSPGGAETGTFLVTSGGAGNGGLSTLAGFGRFTNQSEPAGTLSINEHLAITSAPEAAA